MWYNLITADYSVEAMYSCDNNYLDAQGEMCDGSLVCASCPDDDPQDTRCHTVVVEQDPDDEDPDDDLEGDGKKIG